MKNGCDKEDYWFLTPADKALILAKSLANQLGFAVLLVFFRDRGRFPRIESEIDPSWAQELASRLHLVKALDCTSIINGRTAERFRAEIRLRFGFREATVNDTDMLTDWLRDHAISDTAGDFARLVETFESRCRELAIEPPSADQTGRIVRASIHAHDEMFYGRIYTRLSPTTCTQLDNLLRPTKDSQLAEEDTADTYAVILQLRNNPGRPNLASILDELAKLEMIKKIDLPGDLFDQVSPHQLEQYRRRVEVEAPF